MLAKARMRFLRGLNERPLNSVDEAKRGSITIIQIPRFNHTAAPIVEPVVARSELVSAPQTPAKKTPTKTKPASPSHPPPRLNHTASPAPARVARGTWRAERSLENICATSCSRLTFSLRTYRTTNSTIGSSARIALAGSMQGCFRIKIFVRISTRPWRIGVG